MSVKTENIVQESLPELNLLYKNEPNARLRLRIKCLQLTKQEKFHSQEKIAIHLCVDYATVKRWLKQYREEGLSSLLTIKPKGKPKSIISQEVHDLLYKKVKDSANPLLGYWDAVLWLRNSHKKEINYHTLRKYMIKHFKTKLKEPRKSHYLKCEQSIEDFKKTAQYLRRD